MIDNNTISKIENALGFKLYPMVINYLNDEEYKFIGRKSGLTTAYILKLLLQKETINIKDIGTKYIDSIHGIHYPMFFKHEFIKIMNLLKREGIKVSKIIEGDIMSTEDKIKKTIKQPDIEINTNTNTFKINDFDLSLFAYWNITFNNGKWFYTIKNREEKEINIPIGNILVTLANEGEQGKELLQHNVNVDKLTEDLANRLREQM